MHVQDLMAHPAITCHVNDSLDAAATNRPLGVISLNDLAVEAVQPDTRMKHGISKVTHTLAAVCQPHVATPRAA